MFQEPTPLDDPESDAKKGMSIPRGFKEAPRRSTRSTTHPDYKAIHEGKPQNNACAAFPEQDEIEQVVIPLALTGLKAEKMSNAADSRIPKNYRQALKRPDFKSD